MHLLHSHMYMHNKSPTESKRTQTKESPNTKMECSEKCEVKQATTSHQSSSKDSQSIQQWLAQTERETFTHYWEKGNRYNFLGRSMSQRPLTNIHSLIPFLTIWPKAIIRDTNIYAWDVHNSVI